MNRMTFKIVILCIGMVSFMSCENNIKEINRFVEKAASGSYETGVDGEILYSDSAHLKVRIKFDTMARILDPGDQRDVFPKGVIVYFYDNDGAVSSILTANSAERIAKKNIVVAKDSVHLVSRNGEELLTNELIWDEWKKEVYTNRFVKLTRPGEIIYSFGFKSNQEFTKYEINAISGKLKKENIEGEF
ncbi:MAG TPA: LPS export ABC transporter periplasmic protein LptC [Saprospiraceae bacterium]|nr:LPS export ABC transporter periplasmic protein LptC [Saprospiraceae bacterium]